MKWFLVIIIFLFLFRAEDGNAKNKSELNQQILLEGIYINNFGEFGNTWSSAAGGYLSFGISLTEYYYVYFRTGFIKNILRKNINIENGTFVSIPIEVGVKYYLFEDRIMPYFQFINGVNLIFENVNLNGEESKMTLAKYAWQVGAGITYSINDIWFLDTSINYQSNFYHTKAMNTGIEYSIGTGFRF